MDRQQEKNTEQRKREWVKPEVSKTEAGSAEGAAGAGTDAVVFS